MKIIFKYFFIFLVSFSLVLLSSCDYIVEIEGNEILEMEKNIEHYILNPENFKSYSIYYSKENTSNGSDFINNEVYVRNDKYVRFEKNSNGIKYIYDKGVLYKHDFELKRKTKINFKLDDKKYTNYVEKYSQKLIEFLDDSKILNKTGSKYPIEKYKSILYDIDPKKVKEPFDEIMICVNFDFNNNVKNINIELNNNSDGISICFNSDIEYIKLPCDLNDYKYDDTLKLN